MKISTDKKQIYIHKGEECILTGRTASRKAQEFAKFGIEATDEKLVEITYVEAYRSRSGGLDVRNDWVVEGQLYKLDTK